MRSVAAGLLAFVLLTPVTVLAQARATPPTPIAYVSMQKVLTESTQARAGAKRLEELRQSKTQEIAAKQKALESTRLQLANAGGIFSASTRTKLRAQETEQQSELQKLTQDAQNELQTLQRQLQADLRREFTGDRGGTGRPEGRADRTQRRHGHRLGRARRDRSDRPGARAAQRQCRRCGGAEAGGETLRIWPAVTIAAAAILLRVWIGLSVHSPGAYLHSDMANYDRVAQHLSHGLQSAPDTFYPVGYPAFLGLIYRLTDRSFVAVAIVQSLLGGTTCLLVWLLTKQMAGSGTGALAAAAGVSFYPPLVYYGSMLLTESIAPFFLTLAVWLLLRTLHRPTGIGAAATGTALAVATLVRPNFLLLYPFVVLLAWWVHRSDVGKGMRAAGQILACSVPLLALVSANNSLLAGRLTGVRYEWRSQLLSHASRRARVDLLRRLASAREELALFDDAQFARAVLRRRVLLQTGREGVSGAARQGRPYAHQRRRGFRAGGPRVLAGHRISAGRTIRRDGRPMEKSPSEPLQPGVLLDSRPAYGARGGVGLPATAHSSVGDSVVAGRIDRRRLGRDVCRLPRGPARSRTLRSEY